MNFQEAERVYQDLRSQYSAGKLSSTDFEEQVSKLKLQDADGKWWQIGVQSGDWYMHDGQKWSKARPPLSMEPAITPTAPPEGASEAADAAIPAPAPIPGMSAKESRPRVAPRLFSSKPAGREGGLPTPILIAIIAIVAVIGLTGLIVGFLFVSGQLGGTTTAAKSTPTSSVAVVAPPTTTLPTFAPIVPTNTLIPVVPVVSPTQAITPTAVVTTTAAAPKPTATKKPVATTAPPAATATKAPNVPPGLYVTKLALDPPQPTFNEPVGFKVTIMNTTGEFKVLRWLVKIFKCTQDPCAADDFRRSFGETMSVESQFVAGTVEVTVPKNWSTGIGACTYVAQPHYYDPVTQQLVPFLQTNGQPLYYVFKMCQ